MCFPFRLSYKNYFYYLFNKLFILSKSFSINQSFIAGSKLISISIFFFLLFYPLRALLIIRVFFIYFLLLIILRSIFLITLLYFDSSQIFWYLIRILKLSLLTFYISYFNISYFLFIKYFLFSIRKILLIYD